MAPVKQTKGKDLEESILNLDFGHLSIDSLNFDLYNDYTRSVVLEDMNLTSSTHHSHRRRSSSPMKRTANRRITRRSTPYLQRQTVSQSASSVPWPHTPAYSTPASSTHATSTPGSAPGQSRRTKNANNDRRTLIQAARLIVNDCQNTRNANVPSSTRPSTVPMNCRSFSLSASNRDQLRVASSGTSRTSRSTTRTLDGISGLPFRSFERANTSIRDNGADRRSWGSSQGSSQRVGVSSGHPTLAPPTPWTSVFSPRVVRAPYAPPVYPGYLRPSRAPRVCQDHASNPVPSPHRHLHPHLTPAQRQRYNDSGNCRYPSCCKQFPPAPETHTPSTPAPSSPSSSPPSSSSSSNHPGKSRLRLSSSSSSNNNIPTSSSSSPSSSLAQMTLSREDGFDAGGDLRCLGADGNPQSRQPPPSRSTAPVSKMADQETAAMPSEPSPPTSSCGPLTFGDPLTSSGPSAATPSTSCERSDDINVEELAVYFEHHVNIPKKMSDMAENMYN